MDWQEGFVRGACSAGGKNGWLRLLLSEVSDMAFACDNEARLRYMNKPFQKAMTRGETDLGRPFAALFPAGARKSAERASAKALAGEAAECAMPGPATVIFRIRPLENDGRVFGFFGVGLPSPCSLFGRGKSECSFELEQLVQERTAELISTNETLLNEILGRKQAEKALKESENRYRAMLETVHDAIFVADAGTDLIIHANSRAAELAGRPVEELIGLHQSKLHSEEHAEQYKAMFRERVRLASPFSGGVQYVKRSDGRSIPVRIATSLAKNGGTLVMHGVFRRLDKKSR